MSLRKDVRTLYPLIPEGMEDDELVSLPPGFPLDYFVYCGGYDVRKNVPRLIEAMSAINDDAAIVGLVLIGIVPDFMVEDVERLGSVGWMPGFVSDRYKYALIRGSAGVVYPSKFEGFGLPVVEALVCSVPIVAGTGGSLAEVGGPALITIDPARPMSIAKGMLLALKVQDAASVNAIAAAQLRVLREKAG